MQDISGRETNNPSFSQVLHNLYELPEEGLCFSEHAEYMIVLQSMYTQQDHETSLPQTDLQYCASISHSSIESN